MTEESDDAGKNWNELITDATKTCSKHVNEAGEWLYRNYGGSDKDGGMSSSWQKSFESTARNTTTSSVVPIVILLIIFWPVLTTLFLALAAASTWLFWLLTSAVFGVLQLIYVTYQFIMISVDIGILSILKMYSILRNQVVYSLMGGKSAALRSKKNQRRRWRAHLNQATTYQQYLQLDIREKEKEQTINYKNNIMTSGAKHNANRRFSFSGKRSAALADTKLHHSLTDLTSLFRSSGSTDNNNNKSSSYFFGSSHPAPSPTDSGSTSSQDDQDDEYIQQLAQDLGIMTAEKLVTTTERLQEARTQASKNDNPEMAAAAAAGSLKHLLSGVVKRNHLTLDEILRDNARSVAVTGQFGISQQARDAISSYYQEVEKCLDWIANAPPVVTTQQQQQQGNSDNNNKKIPRNDSFNANGDPLEPNISMLRRKELRDRITLVRKMKQNMGRTALMLSGGGAQAMYHLGTIRALIDADLYKGIKVISGTSGGAITAAMCALRSPQDLIDNVCVSTISTDFPQGSAEMKKHNIRWFPSIMEMGAYWLKHKLLVDSRQFKRCCDYYFGDATFEEAFQITGKHVCITVSASRASGGTAQRLLLNHISTPHVTLSSAVAASCALPGVMAPAKLLTKDRHGNQEPFEVDGVEWIDGSVQADLPFQRISTLFNVSNYVVAQTNFHVVPFLNKAHHPNQRSLYWKWFQTMEWDIRNRALKLSRLGLFPRMFGQDISKVFKQKYHGHLTLVPRFTAMQTFGLKALANPTVKDMEGYLKYGQIAAWPYLSVISDMVRLEKALDQCLERLKERCKSLNSDGGWMDVDDDVESIASSSVPAAAMTFQHRFRFLGGGGSSRGMERLKEKVFTLERENFSLKQEVDELKKLLSANGINGIEMKEQQQEPEQQQYAPFSEGHVMNLVRQRSATQDALLFDFGSSAAFIK